jgi:hypothetical protein
MIDLNDDFIWTPLMHHITGKFRLGHGSFPYQLNCPMCISRGETVDTKYRCGITRSANGFGVNCFNCRFTCGYKLGKSLSQRVADFLAGIGMPDREIKLIRLTAQSIVGFVKIVEQTQPDFNPQFATVELPFGSQSLNHWESVKCTDPNYLAVTDYLLERGEAVINASRYYWSPVVDHGLNRKLLIPCWYERRLVGWIGRSIDPDKRKYYNQTPPHFLFNSSCLTRPNRKYLFIVEGIFDALVIGGVAAGSNSLSSQQIRWINQSGKIPVVIPDQDHAGRGLINIAIQQKWAVSFPNNGRDNWWHSEMHIKDVDEAVRQFGKLYTLRSIIETIVYDPVEIKLLSGALDKVRIGSISN